MKNDRLLNWLFCSLIVNIIPLISANWMEVIWEVLDGKKNRPFGGCFNEMRLLNSALGGEMLLFDISSGVWSLKATI